MAARSKSSSCVSEVEYKSVSYTMTTGNRQKLRLIVVSSAVSRITMHELEVKAGQSNGVGYGRSSLASRGNG